MKNISNYIIEKQNYLVGTTNVDGILNNSLNHIKKYDIKNTIKNLISDEKLYTNIKDYITLICINSGKLHLYIKPKYIEFNNIKYTNNDDYIKCLNTCIKQAFDEYKVNKLVVIIKYNATRENTKLFKDYAGKYNGVFSNGLFMNTCDITFKSSVDICRFFNNLPNLLSK